MFGWRRCMMMMFNPKERALKQVTVKKDGSVADNGMAEIYQSNSTQQALLRREGPAEFTRITNFVKCRDFLVDTYSYAKENRDFGIYGFQFKGSKMQPDWTGVYIQMKFHDSHSRDNFAKHLKILHKIEETNGYDRTETFEVKDEKDIVVVADKRWLDNCLSFSLYSLLLRCMCYTFDAGKDWIAAFSGTTGSDCKYIASVPRKTLDKVLADLTLLKTKEFCGFNPANPSTGVGMVHHNSGFISVFGSHSEISPTTVRTNQHWKELTTGKNALESGTKAA